MGIIINIDTSTGFSPNELDALAALIHVLGGRLPAAMPGAPSSKTEAAPASAPVVTPAAPTEAAAVPPPPPATSPSEALMAAEAARAAPATPPSDGYTGPWPRELPGGVKVDSRGLPHDLRIHASTASTKADGTWTYKRGVASDDDGKALIAQVEKELLATMNAPTPPAAAAVPPPPPADDAGVPPPPAHTDPAAAFGGVTVPPPPPAEGTVPPPPPASDSAAVDFVAVMRTVLKLQSEGKLTTEETTQAAKDIGLPGLPALRNRPDLISAFLMLLPEA